MTEDFEIKLSEAIRKAFAEHHTCLFSEEERGLLRDLLTGAKALKKAIIMAIVVALLAGIGIPYAAKFIK